MTVQAEINRHDLCKEGAPARDDTAPRRVACQETARVERRSLTHGIEQNTKSREMKKEGGMVWSTDLCA